MVEVDSFNDDAVTRNEKLAGLIIERSDRSHPADAVLRDELRRAKLPRKESSAVAELVFTYFRWFGWLQGSDSLETQMRVAGELDVRFLREPDSFSTDELRQAVPAWVADEMALERSWLLTLQTRPVLWLRARRGLGREVVRQIGNCVRGEGWLADTLEYHGERDLFQTESFQAGDFEVQDIASQIVGFYCAPRPGETWWDACAGEGGKTLHLSDLMENKGLIWATDRSRSRLVRLKRRAARAGVFNYRIASWDGSARLPTKTKFDGVLIDAPCSGVGTWQRNPHARWTSTPADVRELAAVQQRLLLNAGPAVKPGGKLIYAVCTLTRSETDAVADLCSRQLSEFAPSPLPAWPNVPPGASARIWPQTFRGNGMFVSAWVRSS